MLYVWTHYGRLLAVATALSAILAFENLLTRPLAFVTGASQVAVEQWVWALLVSGLTLIAVRVTKRELIGGVLAARSGAEVPQLVGDIAGMLIVFTGICIVLAAVFKRDITAFVAAGGASIMILGLALRDMLLAAFTGVVLNVEKPFKIGDMIRVADKFQGRVVRVTWRVTVLLTPANETIIVPNLLLSNAIIVNLDSPDTRARRSVEVVIDYDTSVESAERILYAAALAAGVKLVAQPSVSARKMERDGVLYEIAFTIANFADFKKAEHDMIKSVLTCMRDARITVSFPKTEMIAGTKRSGIAGRSLDSFFLVQQCRLFRGLPDPILARIAEGLVEHSVRKGAVIVRAGDRRHSLFIVGEGMAKRQGTSRDASVTVEERFIATEAFGRRALFCLDAQSATVVAETDVLVYEFPREALTPLFDEHPDLRPTLAQSLARLAFKPAERPDGRGDEDQMRRLVGLYQGQIEACYPPNPSPQPLRHDRALLVTAAANG